MSRQQPRGQQGNNRERNDAFRSFSSTFNNTYNTASHSTNLSMPDPQNTYDSVYGVSFEPITWTINFGRNGGRP